MVDELVAEAKAARRAKAAYERHMERVRDLLPAVRATDPKKFGPAVLEAMILNLYERGTISRMTAEAIGASRKNREAAES